MPQAIFFRIGTEVCRRQTLSRLIFTGWRSQNRPGTNLRNCRCVLRRNPCQNYTGSAPLRSSPHSRNTLDPWDQGWVSARPLDTSPQRCRCGLRRNRYGLSNGLRQGRCLLRRGNRLGRCRQSLLGPNLHSGTLLLKVSSRRLSSFCLSRFCRLGRFNAPQHGLQ